MKSYIRVSIVISMLFLWSNIALGQNGLQFDWAWQVKAIMDHDIYRPFGNEIDGVEKIIKAKALIIWAQQDIIVNSEPAQTFARRIHANTFALTGDCGHLSFLCEGEALPEVVKRFME